MRSQINGLQIVSEEEEKEISNSLSYDNLIKPKKKKIFD